MTSYQVDYSFNLGATRVPREDPPLIAPAFDVFPISEEDCVVRRRGTRQVAILKRDVVAALDACDEFRNLNGQVDRICSRLPHLAGHRENVRQVLEHLGRLGLLVSASDVLSSVRLPEGQFGRPTMPIQSAFIRTCGRTKSLMRLLTVLGAPERLEGRVQRYVVIDDSPDPDAQRAVEALVSEIAGQTGLPLVYFGHGARDRLTRLLADRVGLDGSALRVLWMPDPGDPQPGYGVGLNLALVLSAGTRLALIDDDAVPIPLKAPVTVRDPRFRSGTRDFRFFGRNNPAMDGHSPLDFDPVLAHAASLGMGVGGFLARLGVPMPSAIMGDLNRLDLGRLRADSVIKITTNGVYGDPGTRGMQWAFEVPDGGYASLTADASGYIDRLSARWVWTGRGEPTLSTVGSLMTTTMTGIDNTEFLLPTIPRGRGEDMFFSSALGALYPHALKLELPWALLHRPDEERTWDPALLDQPERLDINRYLSDHIGERMMDEMAADTVTRSRALAAALGSLGRSGEGLREELEKYTVLQRSSLLHSLNQKMNEHPDAPDFWRRDVERIVTANSPALTKDDAVHIDACVPIVRRRAVLYADALEFWEAAWSYCRDEGADVLVEACVRP
jgi:hypothetical protein